MVVAQCVDGLSEVEHQHGILWVVAVDEDTHHVSLPLTSAWTMVLVSDTTEHDDCELLDCQHHSTALVNWEENGEGVHEKEWE
jgi:hypothetical protein